MTKSPTAEQQRLEEARDRKSHWKRWGPYLSERAWGTVREDYSEHGTAWEYVSHDHARSKAYRWNEDGIAGISDRHQKICFSVALWNGRTLTHSYMKYLYKYPQAAFPYQQLVEENRNRGRGDREFELIDTVVFHENRYFDVFVEYAKASGDDILIKISAANRGPEAAELHLLPTIWFRNTHGNKRPARINPPAPIIIGVLALRRAATSRRNFCTARGCSIWYRFFIATLSFSWQKHYPKAFMPLDLRIAYFLRTNGILSKFVHLVKVVAAWCFATGLPRDRACQSSKPTPSLAPEPETNH